ncbi:hypothetical protein GRFL_1810 [Christiangramia flava JLT2011]|uniref:Uncharacterized protein n=1 Tax=Christiangramia flava JLT2011 TaxID=1229726 RepID=A0A1L7I5N5_9FLAO|nr:hypothetical protein GRFL_1810 [Christiangramia flava JLT2011]
MAPNKITKSDALIFRKIVFLASHSLAKMTKIRIVRTVNACIRNCNF